MPADGNVNMGNVPPKAFAVSGKQILCGKPEQLFIACFKQLAADGLRRIVVERGVGGKNCAFGTGNPDKLVGRNNVAQPLAAVNHIVPRKFAVVFFFRETVQFKIGNQPWRVFGNIQTKLFGRFNNAGGNHQRHGGDNVLRGDGNGFSFCIITQPHFNPAV